MITSSFENRAKELTTKKFSVSDFLKTFHAEEDVAMKKFLLMKLAKDNQLKSINDLLNFINTKAKSISHVEVQSILSWSLK